MTRASVRCVDMSARHSGNKLPDFEADTHPSQGIRELTEMSSMSHRPEVLPVYPCPVQGSAPWDVMADAVPLTDSLSGQAAQALRTACPKQKAALTHRIFQALHASAPPLGVADIPESARTHSVRLLTCHAEYKVHVVLCIACRALM